MRIAVLWAPRPLPGFHAEEVRGERRAVGDEQVEGLLRRQTRFAACAQFSSCVRRCLCGRVWVAPAVVSLRHAGSSPTSASSRGAPARRLHPRAPASRRAPRSAGCRRPAAPASRSRSSRPSAPPASSTTTSPAPSNRSRSQDSDRALPGASGHDRHGHHRHPALPPRPSARYESSRGTPPPPAPSAPSAANASTGSVVVTDYARSLVPLEPQRQAATKTGPERGGASLGGLQRGEGPAVRANQ